MSNIEINDSMSDIDKESGFKKGSNEYWDYKTEENRLGYKIINERNPGEKTRIIKDELEKCTSLASARALAQVLETDRQLTEIHELLKPREHHNTARPVVMQGGIIYGSSQGLHTPTMEEIIQKANKPDPTAPYLDTNSDIPRMIDPMEPHWSGGEYSQFIDPRKPSPKIGGPA